jgi:hypothetical protein
VDVNGNESPYVTLGPSATVDASAGLPVELALEVDSPARNGRLKLRFALATAAPATLELFDVTGRRVVWREVGSLGSGPHTLDATEGGRLTPGLYLVRLAQGGNVRIARGVVLE